MVSVVLVPSVSNCFPSISFLFLSLEKQIGLISIKGLRQLHIAYQKNLNQTVTSAFYVTALLCKARLLLSLGSLRLLCTSQ